MQNENPFAQLDEPWPRPVERVDQDVTPAADGHEDTEADDTETEQADDAGAIDGE